jgi:hypothetical protein
MRTTITVCDGCGTRVEDEMFVKGWVTIHNYGDATFIINVQGGRNTDRYATSLFFKSANRLDFHDIGCFTRWLKEGTKP